jgi:hypothetical protein
MRSKRTGSAVGVPSDKGKGTVSGASNGSPENDLTRLRAGDRTEQMRSLLGQLGVSDRALGRLKGEGIAKLAGLCAKQGNTTTLVISMVNEVAKTTPAKLDRLLSVISTYKGSMPILNTFLTMVGNRNPFIAAERSVIQVLPAAEGGVVRGASGHILKGTTYCAFDPEAPNSTVGYLSAKQAITRIFEAFYPERFSEESRQRAHIRRSKAITNELRALSLETLNFQDIESNPDVAEGIRSQLIARNLVVYQQLREAIEHYRFHLASQVYGGNVVLPAVNSLRVASDPGRQLWGWFEDHIKENPNVPQGIRLAFANLRDPDVELSPDEERHYIQGLLAYQRLNSFINKSVALHGLKSDLDVYDALPGEDPLRLDSGIERSRQSVQEKIGSSGDELTMSEFSAMLEQAAMVDFRRRMNTRVLARYGDEFQQALAQFEFVSFDKGAWREDALTESVPMERLKKHIYGAKVGVERQSDSVDKKRALLGQADFKHIMDAQFLTRLVSDPDKLLNAKPVAEFKEMVEGVIVAYRKARFMDGELAKFRETPVGASVSCNPHDVGESLSEWKPVLPLGGKYRPAEVWALEASDAKPRVTNLGEVAQRLQDGEREVFASGKGKEITALKEQHHKARLAVHTYAQAGLYLPEMEGFWRGIEERVRDFTPISEIEALVDGAARIVAHPMVVSFQGYLPPERDIPSMLRKRFLSPSAVNTLKDFVSVKGDIEALTEGSTLGELSELRRRIDTMNLRHATLYKGGIIGIGKARKLSLESKAFSSVVGEQRHQKVSWVVYYDPRPNTNDPQRRTLKQKVDAIERSTMPLTDLGSAWCDRAKKLCSKEGRAALAAHGLPLVDNETFRASRGLFIGSSRVTPEFVKIVNELMPE